MLEYASTNEKFLFKKCFNRQKINLKLSLFNSLLLFWVNTTFIHLQENAVTKLASRATTSHLEALPTPVIKTCLLSPCLIITNASLLVLALFPPTKNWLQSSSKKVRAWPRAVITGLFLGKLPVQAYGSSLAHQYQQIRRHTDGRQLYTADFVRIIYGFEVVQWCTSYTWYLCFSSFSAKGTVSHNAE